MENQNLQFGTSITDINYTKGEAGQYILKTISQSNTFDYVTQYLNVKNNLVLQAASVGNIIRDYTGDFSTDSGTLSMKGVTLSPVDKEVIVRISRRNLKQLWDAAKYRATWDATAPLPELVDFVTATFSKKASLEMENLMWNNTGSTLTGLLVQAAADATVIDVAAATAITESNIIAEIKKVYTAIPESVKETGEAKIYLNSGNLALYKMAIGSLGVYNGSLVTNEVNRLYFDTRIELVPISSIGALKMLATHVPNIVFGTDALSDFNTLNVVDERQTNRTDNYSMLMTFTADIKLVWGADVVLYA
jgi:hypothetical protein